MALGITIFAAQYLRMSTEHQQYSTENQAVAIEAYAQSHAFEIVQTYLDTARSGVVLRRRLGLQRLLQDVVRGNCHYRAILVYDVSRWGRFQDTDEAAHYEFVCKSAGIPVHYCAEAFANDGSMSSLIMKTLKRTMAGEYSRELGDKVLAGQKRLAALGFKQGGRAGYGLRRVLITPDRTPKQTLAFGERKSIATDRVVLEPGRPDEVECVRGIFRMLIDEGRTVHGIARELNRRRVAYTGRSSWDYQAVCNILTHPKYVGCHAFARTTSRLYTPSVKRPQAEWILTPGAFKPVVDRETFDRAQEVLRARTYNKSDEQILGDLQALLKSEGRLTLKIIKESRCTPSPSTYRKRFGSLRQAYATIGYGSPDQFGRIDLRRKTIALREELIQRIVSASEGAVSVVKLSGRWRSRLRMPDGRVVSVVVVRAVRVWKNAVRWIVDRHQEERNFVTLVTRLNERNDGFLDFHIFRQIKQQRRFRVSLNDPWLKQGQSLRDLSRLSEQVRLLLRRLRT
jgi:DNA invertase Pin-like site-specific DNA recombinase